MTNKMDRHQSSAQTAAGQNGIVTIPMAPDWRGLVDHLTTEHGIERQEASRVICERICEATRPTMPAGTHMAADIHWKTNKIAVAAFYDVVDQVSDPVREVDLATAQAEVPGIKLGATLGRLVRPVLPDAMGGMHAALRHVRIRTQQPDLCEKG